MGPQQPYLPPPPSGSQPGMLTQDGLIGSAILDTDQVFFILKS
jgi:hypothetical protein